jgi:hypothetical protein
MWTPARGLQWRQRSRRFKERKAYDTRAAFAALGPLEGVVAELSPEQARPLVHLEPIPFRGQSRRCYPVQIGNRQAISRPDTAPNRPVNIPKQHLQPQQQGPSVLIPQP